MNKSSHFTGQPIFTQILKLISRQKVNQLAKLYMSDRYYKRFKTYDHLVTMLFAILSKCTSLREVTTGLIACDTKLHHLGMSYFPRRSTLSDANCNRTAKVFEQIYYKLYQRYKTHLPDSQTRSWKSKLYIFDSTTISLFQEILKNAGRNPMNGKRKGGIKAHTLIKADEDVPCLVHLTPGSAHDSPFMKMVDLPEGSIVVFDKGYNDYHQYEKWSCQNIYFVTRINKAAVYETLSEYPISSKQHLNGVVRDQQIRLGHHHHTHTTKVIVRMVTYHDRKSKRTFHFITNNFQFSPVTIANIYKKRWQIETLYKRIKQNYPLKYFLGDNENAIKIQIWCALIADLLLKVIRRQVKRKWAFANLSSMVRLHLMNYIHLYQFLNNPEKALSKKLSERKTFTPSLFPT